MKGAVNSAACYVTPNPPPQFYNRLTHFNSPPPVPIRESNSESSLTGYKQVYPKCQNTNAKPYLQVSVNDFQAAKSPTLYHNPATNGLNNNDDQNSNEIEAYDMDIVPSTIHPSYVTIKNNKT